MSAQHVKGPDEKTVLDTLDRSHPRLMLKDNALAELKRRAQTDPLVEASVAALLKRADAICGKPMLVYKKIGPRLLRVSRECMHRMYTLGLAWRLTGRPAYLDKAKEDLLAVCAFKDWNPSHFLDTAEMSHAVGIGYDWFYPALDEPTREKIRDGLIRNGMKPGVAAYAKDTRLWWVSSDHNWNQVCNGGLIVGALAIADTDPQYAQKIIPAAVRSLPKALATYSPDGAWGEGPGYWEYATRYTVFGLAALDSALGTDFGLSDDKGLSQAGWFPIYAAGPTGVYFNFADAGEHRRGNVFSFFWLSRRYGDPYFAAVERRAMQRDPGDPMDLVWYVPPPDMPPSAPPLDKHFGGPVAVAMFRSAWDDPNALYVAVKAGFNQVNHGHLDLGTFVLDALGVRWARDLGSDDYNLPGYWDRSKSTGRRWTYYRLNSLSHNVPLLDGKNQDVFAKSTITRYDSTPARAFAVLDLTAAYRPTAQSVHRGVLMLDRKRVLVQDEFDLAKPCDVTWGITTGAEVKLEGSAALLTQDGKRLRVEVLSPADVKLAVESAERKPPEKTNEGFRRLVLHLPHQSGNVRIAVLFTPQYPDAKAQDPPVVKALADW